MILAIDTSGQVCSVAAVLAGETVFARTGATPRAHAEELAPLVAEAMALGPLTGVVAGRGPGSFTGLRVGLATAQVLGWTLSVPVTGICSLDVVAASAGLRTGWVVMDARRGELFHRRYAHGRPAGDASVATREEVRGLVGGDPVVGDVALLTSARRRDSGTTVIDPEALAVVAASCIAAGETTAATPLYLRRPDVTMTAANLPGGGV